MKTDTHNDIIIKQYASQSNAYLASAVHAQGEDLERMASLIGPRPDAVALDMGCGGGHVSYRMAGLVNKVVAYDLAEAMLATVAKEAQRRGLGNIVTKQGAAEALPCPSESFDVVATRYSAHHWHAFTEGLAQMHRVMKTGGLAIFMDVVTPGVPLLDTWLQSMELLRDSSHLRNASLAEWTSTLTSLGFEVGEVTKYRLRLEFVSWTERMNTPETHVAAIRSLQRRAAAAVTDYFEIEKDGSFTVDTVLIVAHKS